MSTTQIPPGAPLSSTQAPRPEADLYDAERWESVFQELHSTPALLVQLQDDLARSRRREAVWMSIVFHLLVVIVIVNSQKLGRLIHPQSVVVVSPNDVMRQKELTYLEMPPDEQKVTKRPDTNITSDKDRTAMSKTPRVDPKELKKILDSARAGRPGMPSPPPQPGQPAAPPQAAAQNSPSPQPAQPSQTTPPTTDQNQMARLQPPQATAPKPSFNTGPMSAGSAIEQAARAALANRGGYGGDGGDYGLGQGRQAAGAVGPLDVLSDTMGVDFGPYLNRVLHDVRENWYRIIPESAQAPMRKKGKVSIEFAILKDGKVAGLTLISTSGDVSLDRAAYGGITASNPFPPLPAEFRGQYLALRFHFFYNPDQNDLR
jgi:TonB family protein